MTKQFKYNHEAKMVLFFECSGCSFKIESDEIILSNEALLLKITETCYECGTQHHIYLNAKEGEGEILIEELPEISEVEIQLTD